MTDRNQQLRDQFEWFWTHHSRARLQGLSDEEYFWEPVAGAWSIRPHGTSTAQVSLGTGEFTMDWAEPEPVPAPFTTIAWRLGHVVVGVLAMRTAGQFGGPPVEYETFSYAGTAAEALAQLDHELEAWFAGVASLGEDGLARPCGPAEGPWADHPLTALVLHVNRELLHHLAEVALLRDLYVHRYSKDG